MAKAAADTGLLKVPMSEAREIATRCIEIHRPCFLHGQPGVGKSALIQQLGFELRRPVVDVRLALFDPSDLKGIPYFDSNTGEMKWSVPGELPKSGRMRQVRDPLSAIALEQALDEEDAILFLDELSSAPGAVQAAAYQLVLDRKIGDYTLPKNCSIVAAGNRMSDRGVVNRMASPLANRFASHLEIDAVFSDWTKWAVARGIRPEVIGFLSSAQQYWNMFEANKESYAFATPRTWEMISELVEDKTSEQMCYKLVAGAVGEGVAMTFTQYRQLAMTIPDVRRLFIGETINAKDLPISIKYTLMYNIAFGLKDLMLTRGATSPEYVNAFNHVYLFVAEQVEPEMAILASRLFTQEFGLTINAKSMSNFNVFWAKVSKYVGGAK